MNSVTLAELTGEADWQLYTHNLPEGSLDVHFRYEKDDATTGGADAAWKDQVTFTPTAFASWIALRRSTLTASGDDPDGDGLPNLMDYAFQSDPSIAGASPLPQPTVAGVVLTWDIPQTRRRSRSGMGHRSYFQPRRRLMERSRCGHHRKLGDAPPPAPACNQRTAICPAENQSTVTLCAGLAQCIGLHS